MLTIALWVFVCLMFLPVVVGRYKPDEWDNVLIDSSTFIASMLFGLGIFVAFRASLNWHPVLRGLVLAGSVLAVSILQTIYDFLFEALLTANLDLDVYGLTKTAPYEKIFTYLIIFVVNLGLFQVAMTRRGSMRNDRLLTDARAAAQQAQLQALRYQLNPHFLFNTLNSISSLIVTRRNEDAEEMTSRLSSFLRSSLGCDPTGLVPLDAELALTEEYLGIEAVRFGERLNVEVDCGSKAGAMMIPSFLVQPLVENAIKHGVAPSVTPVTIRIQALLDGGMLNILIENCRPEVEDRVSVGAGVGIANVRQRLAAVYGESARLTTEQQDGVFRATIHIPEVKTRSHTS